MTGHDPGLGFSRFGRAEITLLPDGQLLRSVEQVVTGSLPVASSFMDTLAEPVDTAKEKIFLLWYLRKEYNLERFISSRKVFCRILKSGVLRIVQYMNQVGRFPIVEMFARQVADLLNVEYLPVLT